MYIYVYNYEHTRIRVDRFLSANLFYFNAVLSIIMAIVTVNRNADSCEVF